MKRIQPLTTLALGLSIMAAVALNNQHTTIAGIACASGFLLITIEVFKYGGWYQLFAMITLSILFSLSLENPLIVFPWLSFSVLFSALQVLWRKYFSPGGKKIPWMELIFLISALISYGIGNLEKCECEGMQIWAVTAVPVLTGVVVIFLLFRRNSQALP